MFRARCVGSTSISVACASETKAPVAGLPSKSAASRSPKPPARAVSPAEAAKKSPPTTITRRRARGVAQDADERIERAPDETRDGEDEPDLGVAQPEVVPNRRPRGRAGASDELVEQLDREQRRDEGRSATPGGSGSAANRHSRILAHPPPRVERQSSAYENVHWTATLSVAPPALR